MMLVLAAIGPTPSIFRVGGTAERAAQASAVPVLLVRDPAPLRAWLAGDRMTVAAMIGEDAASDRAIEWLHVLRRIGACDVAALRAYYVDEQARRFGLAPRPLVDHDPEIEALLHRDLERRIGALDGRGALSLHPVLALGRIADHLLDHPAARGAALVVVGNHRAHGLGRLTSVAAGIVHLADASVLVVPAEAPRAAAAPWPSYRRVLVATDFSKFGDAAIAYAYGLVARQGGEVTLLHVMTGPSSEVTRTESTERLFHLIPATPPPRVTSHVEAIWKHDAAPAIVETAARIGADAIVIASHGRSGLRRLVLGSVASGVVERSRIPVLIVRPPADVA
jgi:nucleotide-binding universal stress UspA family protein